MKYFLPLFFILTLMLAPRSVFAASMVLQHAPQSVAGQQQFYVDVAIDADGDSFNAIQGAVAFSGDTLEFVRAETGASIITNFIDQPRAEGGTVRFSGIIVGGFDGLINPFDQSKRFPGQVMRLVFAGKKPGTASIATVRTSVSKNNGQGTLQAAAEARTVIAITEDAAPSAYVSDDTIPPTITAAIVTEKDLYDGKRTLLFTAIDKQSGIDRVELQEKNNEWKTVESPYLLQNQSGKGILSLRAYDAAGNVAQITVGTAATHATGAVIVLSALALFILYVIYKKSKHKKHIL